jgi:hypothetical protein
MFRPPNSVAAQRRQHRNQWMINKIGTNPEGIDHSADSMAVELLVRTHAQTHQDRRRSDRASAECDSFSL